VFAAAEAIYLASAAVTFRKQKNLGLMSSCCSGHSAVQSTAPDFKLSRHRAMTLWLGRS